MYIQHSFSQLYCLKFSFKLANISRSLADVLGIPFLSGHSVYCVQSRLLLLLKCTVN